jgi:hypothetical protein
MSKESVKKIFNDFLKRNQEKNQAENILTKERKNPLLKEYPNPLKEQK